MSQIKVSLNKLAEFAYANSHRRKMIVKQHKDQNSGHYPAIGYREAENFLPGWIDLQLDQTHLQQRLQGLIALQATLQGTNSQSGYVKGINNGVNGLTWLSNTGPIIFPANVTLQSCNQFNSDGLVYGNVLVKARPNGLVLRQIGQRVRVGALKYHFSKGTCLSDEAGDLAAVGIFEFLKLTSGVPADVLHSLCCSVDTCRGSIRTAPSSHVKIHNQLIDACDQYEMIWNSLP